MYTIIDTIKPTTNSIEGDIFKGNADSLFIILEPKEINTIEDLKNNIATITDLDGKTLTYKIILSNVNKQGVVGILLAKAIDANFERLSKVSWLNLA